MLFRSRGSEGRGGEGTIGVNPFLRALISACDLLVLFAAYYDAIGRPRSRSSKKNAAGGWRTVDTPDGISTAPDPGHRCSTRARARAVKVLPDHPYVASRG